MSFLLKKVQQTIEDKLENVKNAHFLLAISGGIDSITLLHVFNKLNLSFQVAHANFQLRGEESLQDEIFVFEQSKKYLDIQKIHIQRFDTLKEHQKFKDTSIQMIARQLRYKWFYQLLQEYSLDYIVTAHHADDNIETFFLKLFRKSPQGLAGMDILSEKRILRPFLNITKHQIQEYAQENNILYREDSSNTKDDYTRNHIRHHLIPFIEHHYPNAKNAILEVMQYQKEIHTLVHAYIDEIWQKSVERYLDCYTINLSVLWEYSQEIQELLPWHFAERLRLGMQQFEQFKHLFEKNTQSGKTMVTNTHKAVRYKQNIQVFPVNVFDTFNAHLFKLYPANSNALHEISKDNILIVSDNFQVKMYSNMLFDDLNFIRLWQNGDKIIHNGKKRLIADLIPEYNITPYQKEYLYVATQVQLEESENQTGTLQRYVEQIVFVFFCPNSVLLQLK